MNDSELNVAQALARLASGFHEQRTGHAPSDVTVVFTDDTLVVSMRRALTAAEITLAATPEGAAQVQNFHRQLFANSTAEMRQEILRLTGRRVRETAAEIEVATGTVVHAFTTGAMVQVYLLTPGAPADAVTGRYPLDSAGDDGLAVAPVVDSSP